MKSKAFTVSALALLAALNAQAAPVQGPAKTIIISLDGATPRIVDALLADGTLSPNEGLGLLKSKGFSAKLNTTVAPSLTAVGHIAIATGSTAAHNDIVANSFHLVKAPFTANISGFGAPIGGYCLDCNNGGPGISPSPTAEPLWLALKDAGRSVVTATWPGGDGVDVRINGGVTTIIQPSTERTIDYTVPFGAFTGPGGTGFSFTSAAAWSPAPALTLSQLTAAGKVSFSPVQQLSLETFSVGGVTKNIRAAALDTTNDGIANYDTVVFFSTQEGIQSGPFALPSTGPAYVKAGSLKSSPFYIEGSSGKTLCAYYICNLAPDLSLARFARYSGNFIPRNTPVLADVDDINNNVGAWLPQADFRFPERINPGLSTFPDPELEDLYEDQVESFVDYQTRVALRAMSQKPNADLSMIYIEQPDGSCHQFLLTDPRQPTDFLNPNSIGAGQDAAKVARYAGYVKRAYKAADKAVQRIIDSVGTDASGKPNANIIVTSDHGFDTFHTAVNFSALLAANGIDTTKVRAITSGPAVNIYIKLIGRDPAGNVGPAEYAMLVNKIARILHAYADTNPTYTLGAPRVPVFQKIYTRPLPLNLNDPSLGRTTSTFIGQDSGDVFAMMTPGYNFDGTQSPAVKRQGDASAAILSLPNFYGAHGYDPAQPNMSAIFYAAGPNIGQGVLNSVRNIDIAPTVLKLYGVPAAATVDGSPLPILVP